MAQTITLEGLRSQLITQLYGRRLALSYGNSSDTAAAGEAQFMVGPKALRVPTLTITTASTAADQVPPYGNVIFNTTGASTSGTTYHSVQNPVPGVSVRVTNISTLAMTLWLNGSTGTTAVFGYARAIGTTGITTATAINLPGVAASVILTGLTTATWLAESNFGTSVTTWGTSAT